MNVLKYMTLLILVIFLFTGCTQKQPEKQIEPQPPELIKPMPIINASDDVIEREVIEEPSGKIKPIACSTDSDCEMRTCPNGEKVQVQSCMENMCRELVFIQDPCAGKDDWVKSEVEVEYSDGKLTYSIPVIKSTPCYKVKVDEQVLESYPVQIVIDVTTVSESKGMCAQVITEEIVTGTIENDAIGSIRINVKGKEVFSKSFAQ